VRQLDYLHTIVTDESRLQTRTRFVQNEEDALENKRNHCESPVLCILSSSTDKCRYQRGESFRKCAQSSESKRHSWLMLVRSRIPCVSPTSNTKCELSRLQHFTPTPPALHYFVRCGRNAMIPVMGETGHTIITKIPKYDAISISRTSIAAITHIYPSLYHMASHQRKRL
jgi:hypothetical protein